MPAKYMNNALFFQIVSINENFPMEIGIIFLEERKGFIYRKGLLNFDRNACSYVLLQLNSVQRLFQFDIINIVKKRNHLLWKEHLEGDIGENQVLDCFDDYVNTISQGDQLNIGSWIGITSKYLPKNLFATTRSKTDHGSRSQKNIA